MNKTLDEVTVENQARWDALNEKIEARHEKFMLDFEAKMDKFDANLEKSRLTAREVVSRIVLLSASIVGFSVTIMSVDSLSSNLNLPSLKLSWVLFVATIFLGLLIPYLESRAKYVIHWRGLQEQDHDNKKTINWRHRLIVDVVTLFAIVFYPRNLTFCRIYKTEEEQKKNAILNGLSIDFANKIINWVYFSEFLFLLTFVASLGVLILSFQF